MCKRIFDESIILQDNAMLKVIPALFDEWDFVKNDELGLDIYHITKFSLKKPHWICLDCGSSYEMQVRYKSDISKCPYCLGRKVNHTNSLANLNHQVALEWHPTKNGELTPHDVTCGSTRKVWWICSEDHEWENLIGERTRGGGCPYCFGRRVWRGYNDIWTTNNKLARQLLNVEDGYLYSQGSNVRVDWKCPDCGNVIKNKRIQIVNQRGLLCKECSDGKSYPEKYIYHLLKQLNVNFEWDITLEWSQNKRYDFYLQDYNMIIEVHGMQHYGIGFESIGGRSLEEERLNDKLKKTLALENGIDTYIELDVRKSNMEWISNSILKSDMNKMFDLTNIDFKDIDLKTNTSLTKTIYELWNSGNTSVTEISEELKLRNETIISYLKKGSLNGSCAYSNNRPKILQFTLTGEFIKTWDTLKMISEHFNVSSQAISSCCKGKSMSSLGYKWIYEHEYEKNEFVIDKSYISNSCNRKCIVQLSKTNGIIKKWRSTAEAARMLNLHGSAISAVCRGVVISTGGFKWMFEDEYEKSKNNLNEVVRIHKKAKSVIQLTKDGEFINEWKGGATEVSRKLNISNSKISDVCRGKGKTSGGYRWMFKEEYEKYIEETAL